MKIIQTQYKYLDKIQHLCREIGKANINIKLTTSIDGGKTEIIFCQLSDFTEALIRAEESDESLLEII